MCSHYRPPNDPQRLQAFFGVEVNEAWRPECQPQYKAPAIKRADTSDGAREGFLGQFGLMPHWAKDTALAKHTYNARAETAAEKPNYRDAWRKDQRCIIPADWIYGASYETGKAARWKIARADGAPMGIAGLWSRWWAHGGIEVLTFAMLTVDASEHPVMNRFHKPEEDKRMVVILDEADHDRWLGCAHDEMMSFMTPYPASRLVTQAAPLPPKAALE